MPEHTERQFREFRTRVVRAGRANECKHCTLKDDIADAIYEVFILRGCRAALDYMEKVRQEEDG